MSSDTKTKSDKAEYVRIKRLREDEGFQALIVEEDDLKTTNDTTNTKRKYIYKRIKLSDKGIKEDTPILEKTSENKFVYKKKRRRSSYDSDKNTDTKDMIQKYTDESLPSEVNSLLADLMAKEVSLNNNIKNPEAKKLLLKNGKKLKLERESRRETSTKTDSDYVYDVYVKEEINDGYDLGSDFSRIAYLKIIDEGTLVYDELSDDKYSDDEDSNEEDYYKNDYPEDEDDDRSVLFGDDYEDAGDMYYGGRRYSGAFDEIEAEQINDFVDYEDFSENIGRYSNNLNSGNFLDSISKNPYDSVLKDGELITDEDDSDDPAYYFTDDEVSEKDDTHDLSGEFSFPRNHFFTTDQDDPMAVYRDRIMHNLEKQIKKADKRK